MPRITSYNVCYTKLLRVAFGLIVWAIERADPAGSFSSPFDGLWWAVVTLATVGYGDKYSYNFV